MSKSIIISVAGAYASGVDGFAETLKNGLLKEFSSANIKIIDMDVMATHRDKRTYSPLDYDFKQVLTAIESSINESEHHNGRINIIIVCGCYALFDNQINKISRLKVFIDSDNDKRLINLIQSRKVDSGEKLTTLLSEYMDHLKPEIIQYIEPSRSAADLIIPCTNDSLGSAIILDGIAKIIEDVKSDGVDNRKVKLWDFEKERMDVEKGRYYDLA